MIVEPFDAPYQPTGMAGDAARCGASGKLANSVRWADREHRRPGLRARRTSLNPTYGHKDHGVECALPTDAQTRSNNLTITILALRLNHADKFY